MAWLLLSPVMAAADPPKVVVSIKPIHALIAGVMAGVGSPDILISGGASPHAYALRPSEARSLSRADLIFWVGESLETFLIKPLKSLGTNATVIELAGAQGIKLLKSREGRAWETHDHGDDRDSKTHENDSHHEHEQKSESKPAHGAYDVHIWLGRDNAKAIVNAAVFALSEKDPSNAQRYRQNGQNVIARIDSTFRDIGARLAAVKHVPYLVFHDAYHYFERDHRLNAAGSISTHEAQKPGAKRLAEIRAKLRAHDIRCVFAEPQFEPALIKTVIGGTRAKPGVLDPLGANLPAGPDAYFRLLENLAENLKECLGKTP
ncbi:MAG: zinc ABC transporter substrate-binding protein [Rhodospirillales bacterium]